MSREGEIWKLESLIDLDITFLVLWIQPLWLFLNFRISATFTANGIWHAIDKGCDFLLKINLFLSKARPRQGEKDTRLRTIMWLRRHYSKYLADALGGDVINTSAHAPHVLSCFKYIVSVISSLYRYRSMKFKVLKMQNCCFRTCQLSPYTLQYLLVIWKLYWLTDKLIELSNAWQIRLNEEIFREKLNPSISWICSIEAGR